MNRKRFSRAAVIAAVLLVMGAGGLVTSWPGASADVAGLIGVGTAQGARVTYTIPKYLVIETLMDGGGPVAQSKLDTSGSYIGFGSLPYPGENAITAPGLISVVTGRGTPVSYPFYVEANYPVSSKVALADPSGAYSLKASADPKQVTGAAQFLAGTADAFASGFATTTSAVLDDSGKLTVSAESVSRGIDVKGVLQIAKVTALSRTVLGPGDSAPVTTTKLLIEGAVVAGQGVTIGPNGISLAGQSVPVPPDQYAKQLNDALKSAGVTVHTVRNEKISGGGTSDSLEILSTQTVPVPGNPTGTLNYHIGSALSYVTGAGGAQAGLGGSIGTGGGTGGVGGGPAVDAVAGSSSSGAGSVAAGASASTGAGASANAPAPSTVTGAPVENTASRTQPLFARDLRSTARWFYAVLAIGGALLLFASALWRRKGVQATWIS